MKIQLYKYDGTPLFEVMVDASSSQSWSLMSDNKLSLSFELEECVVLTAGCYIEFDNTRFYLLTEYKPTMVCRSAWKYDLTLGDAASWLSITLALKTTDGENAPLFKYTGPAVEHAAIIVANLNRLMGTDKWKVGSVISTENITIDYSGKYCSEVLQEIVDIKNTEWWIDDMTLNIGRAEFGDPIELGYQNGLLGDIIREQSDNSKSYRYLYPVGSTRNIDPTKYGYDRLQLPDGRTYIDMNVEQGIAELFEEAAFAHIFPRYEGTVQTVRTQIANGNSGPFVIYYFSDSNIPFNPNDYEIAGLKKQISFLSGELMGEDFEVNYNPSSKEFEIITKYPESSNNIQLPGGLLIPNIGDKYVIWNITMPAEYYSLASQELLEAAEAFAQKYIYDGGIYHASLDYIDVQLRSLRLRPGQRVRLQSPEYFPKTGHYDSRITRVTRSLWYPNEMNIDISSERSMGVIKKLSSDVKSAQTKSNILSATLSTLNAAFVAHKMLFDEFFEKDSAGNIHAKLSLWSSGGLTAGDAGSGGSGGGGISYNRLDSWSDYSLDKAGYVLSALLGKDLDNRVSALANAGYITASYLAPYALRSEIPSLVGYATQSWVGDNYLSKSGGVITGQGDTRYVQLRLDGEMATVMFQQRGIEKGAVGWWSASGVRLQNTNEYGLAVTDSNYPIFYWGKNGSVQRILLHAGNYSDYALPITGGTVNGDISIPVARATRDNSIPVSGGLDRYGKNYYDAVPELKTFIGTIESSDLGWQHTISVRHRNGYSDGATEGLVLRHSLVNVNDSIHWSHQRGGVWSDDRILLDSSNYSNYALPITGGRISGDLKLTSREVGNDNAHSGKLIFAGANNDYGNNDYKMGPYIQAINIGGWGKKKISFFQRDWSVEGFDADPEEVFSIMPNGNILIGSTEDSGEKLQVNGNVKANNFIGNLTGTADNATRFKDLDTSDFARFYEAYYGNPNNMSAGFVGGKLYGADGWVHNYAPFLSVGSNTFKMQFNGWGNALYYRAGDDSGTVNKEWRTIAFTDSNVASATKLATPRTIWGRWFDGTSSIDGDIFPSSSGCYFNANGISQHSNYGWVRDVLLVDSLGGIAVTGNITAPAVTTNTLKVGNVTLVEENGALKVIGGFIATGGVTSGEKAS